MYKKSDVLLRSVFFIFAVELLVWLEGEGLVLTYFVLRSVGDAPCILNPSLHVRSREVLLATLIVAGLFKKLPHAL